MASNFVGPFNRTAMKNEAIRARYIDADKLQPQLHCAWHRRIDRSTNHVHIYSYFMLNESTVATMLF